MANTYTKLYIQIVFAVKGRQSSIKGEFREELQKYISGIIQNKKQKLYASDLVRDIKANSTSFIYDHNWVQGRFEWQRGFDAFSYNESLVNTVVHYILHQPEHHKVKTFREEYIDFLKKFNIDFDNKYLFDFLD